MTYHQNYIDTDIKKSGDYYLLPIHKDVVHLLGLDELMSGKVRVRKAPAGAITVSPVHTKETCRCSPKCWNKFK